MTIREDKILGSLISGALGDALGYQIEFDRGVKPREVTTIRKGAKISDDTQMTLFTLTGLLWHDSIDEEISYSDAIYLSYLDWLDTQEKTNANIKRTSWIKSIPELNELRAPGNTCLSALLSGKKGTLENPLNNSSGCGAVMRVAPIGLYMDTPEQAARLGEESAVITHGNPLAYYSAYILCYLINILLDENINLEDAIKESISNFYKNHFNDDNSKYLIKLINTAIDLSHKKIPDQEAIRILGEGWVSEEALAISIYSSLKHSDNIEEALICAVNHDGDSDSTGAITGNILGTYLGYSNIDEKFMETLELKELIMELGHDLYTGVKTNDEAKKKYITKR